MKIANDTAAWFTATRAGTPAGRAASALAGQAAAGAGGGTVTLSAAAQQAAGRAAAQATAQGTGQATAQGTGQATAQGATAAGSGAQPAAEHPSLAYQRVTLRNAQADPDYARKAAQEFAYNDSYMLHGPLVDISHDPMRYSATGEVVTDEGLATFKSQARQARDELIALYQSEKGKGTPDAEILEKLFRARDGQPNDYLQKLNWARA